LSIAEIIELHCENCDAAVEPTEIFEANPIAQTAQQEMLP